MGLYFYATRPEKPASFPDTILTGLTFSLFALLIGIPFVLLYGAPVHALLARRGSSNYLTSAVVGAVPGVAALLTKVPGIGALALYFGVCIAVAGQWFANRRSASQGNR